MAPFFDYTDPVRSRINRYLLILLLLVLPVQTFASAAMLGCAFSHQGQTSHAHAEKSAKMGEPPATCHEPQQTEKSSTPPTCTHCENAQPSMAADANVCTGRTSSSKISRNRFIRERTGSV